MTRTVEVLPEGHEFLTLHAGAAKMWRIENGVPVDIATALPQEVTKLADAGQTIAAIKELRVLRGGTLADAKAAVEGYLQRNHVRTYAPRNHGD